MSIGDSTYSINPASLQFAPIGEFQFARSAIDLDQSELSVSSYNVSGSITASFGFFSIALWLVGLTVAGIGLFSLSLEKRIGGIHSRELSHQLGSLNLRSATRNVSKNWNIKKEARLFVLMGLGSMALGLLGWLF